LLKITKQNVNSDGLMAVTIFGSSLSIIHSTDWYLHDPVS